MAITEQPETAPLWQRLLWFAALWGGGVLLLGCVAAAIRYVIGP